MGTYSTRRLPELTNQHKFGYAYETELTATSEIFYVPAGLRFPMIAGHPVGTATWNIYATSSRREKVEAGTANWIVWTAGESGDLTTAKEDVLIGNPIALKLMAVSGTVIFEISA